MKKTIAIILALVLALSMAACGSQKPADTQEPSSEPTVSVPDTDTPDATGDKPAADTSADKDTTTAKPSDTNKPSATPPASTPNTNTQSNSTNKPAVDPSTGNETTATADAEGVLNNIWSKYAKADKFSANIQKADLKNPDMLTNTLMVPSKLLEQIDDAACLMHMMNTNTFTGTAFHLKDGTDSKAFATALRDSYADAQWICGSPENLLIASFDGYLIGVFGAADLVKNFKTVLTNSYVNATIHYDEAIDIG